MCVQGSFVAVAEEENELGILDVVEREDVVDLRVVLVLSKEGVDGEEKNTR